MNGDISLQNEFLKKTLDAKSAADNKLFVALLVAIPKDEYLGALHISASSLFGSVAENYRKYFEKLGLKV